MTLSELVDWMRSRGVTVTLYPSAPMDDAFPNLVLRAYTLKHGQEHGLEAVVASVDCPGGSIEDAFLPTLVQLLSDFRGSLDG